jgi:mannose-6-phosphate isomerase
MKLYPLHFVPKLSPKIWGGRLLEKFGKQLPPGVAIGESWDLYDRPEASARVASGPLQGQTLQQVMKEWGPALLGTREFEKGHEQFPLMVKWIDAHEALSVQVHPDDDQALRMVGPHETGKTEMWVVLEAQIGAKVVAGLKDGCSRADFAKALQAGNLEPVLKEFEVQPGDSIYIPAGRVHAIGKGCLIAEIQQNSDTTWRVYDYQRLENGRPRELHVEQALECIRFDADFSRLPALQPSSAPVVSDYFKVERLELKGAMALKNPDACFQILLCVQGEAVLVTPSGRDILKPGDTVLIPAVLDASLEAGSTASASLLWVRP